MILQPIVENSIKHGFDDFYPEEGCKIAIKASVTDDVLEISVRDNGKGIPREKLEKLTENFSVFKEEEKRDSIGLHNIYRRLKLTDEKNEMTISSQENKFTEIVIRITGNNSVSDSGSTICTIGSFTDNGNVSDNSSANSQSAS